MPVEQGIEDRDFYEITNAVGVVETELEQHQSDLNPEQRVILARMLIKLAHQLLEQ